MHNRITLLEVALAQTQARISHAPHPLLESTYLFSSRETVPKKPSTNGLTSLEEEEDDLDGGLGTLTIMADGEARFVGSFAGSEYLREESQEPRGEMPIGLATPPPSASHDSIDSVDGTRARMLALQKDGEVERLRSQLPIWETEGAGLVETYYENVNWM